jgi:hypothetical protein
MDIVIEPQKRLGRALNRVPTTLEIGGANGCGCYPVSATETP